LKTVSSATWLKPNAQPNVTARMLAKKLNGGKHPSRKAIAVVAQSCNRRWVMIEKQPEYTGITHKRLAEVKVPYPKELLAKHRDDHDGKA